MVQVVPAEASATREYEVSLEVRRAHRRWLDRGFASWACEQHRWVVGDIANISASGRCATLTRRCCLITIPTATICATIVAFVTPSMRNVILATVPKTQSFRDAWKQVGVRRLGLNRVKVSPDVASRLAAGCRHVRRLWLEDCEFVNGAYSDLIASCPDLEWLRIVGFAGRDDSRPSNEVGPVSEFAEYLSSLTVPTVIAGDPYVLQHRLGPEWATASTGFRGEPRQRATSGSDRSSSVR